MNVAIIGGGWAGIAAAVTLAGKADVTLFEAGRALGGRARKIGRTDTRGAALDNGQHILLGAYRETLKLMQKINVAPEAELLRRLPLRIQDSSGFRLTLPRLSHPFNLLFGFLGARNIGMGEKLATARWMQKLKARRFAVPPEDDSNVTQWLDAAGQNGRLRRHLWAPLCLAALNTPAERASARVFARMLQESLGNPVAGATDLLLPRVSLSEILPDPACRWLHQRGTVIRLRERVRAVQPLDGCWQIISGRGAKKSVFDQIILAVAPWHLPPLLADLPRADFPAPPQAVEPIATLYLDYPAQSLALPCPLLALSGELGGWLTDRGQGALSIVLSGPGAWEKLTDEALAAALHEDIAAYFSHPVALPPYQVIREKRATFSCRPRLIRCPQKTPWQGLFIAGDHSLPDYPATLEGAVRSGLESARLCLERAPATASR
jgi:squalene-associated FAD-dependent desaturase